MTIDLRRGDVVGVQDDLDFLTKPRPALVVQASDYIDSRDTVIVCLFTKTAVEGINFRPAFNPTPENGLKSPSCLQTDKMLVIRKSRITEPIFGRFSAAEMKKVNRALRLILSL